MAVRAATSIAKDLVALTMTMKFSQKLLFYRPNSGMGIMDGHAIFRLSNVVIGII
ncbi:hypothetical protein D3C85_1836120 [compost metagenome]